MQADFGIITAKLLDAGRHFDFFLVNFGAGQLVQLFGNFLCGHFAVQLAGSAPLDLDRNDLALDLGSQFFSSSLASASWWALASLLVRAVFTASASALQPDRAGTGSCGRNRPTLHGFHPFYQCS